uniref:Outer dense fiber protein 3-like protein 2 n=1 Tax=Triatoma infestans TaxID=30076 RepID=A0A161N124_TRIIF
MATKKEFCGPETPGPGQYTMPPLLGCKSHDVTQWRNPCYSFGIKPKDSSRPPGPGPFEYTINNVTRFGKITSPSAPLTARPSGRSLQALPGPGTYSPEVYLNSVLPKAPAFQFGRKLPSKKLAITPGPNAYDVPGPEVYGKRPPSYSILGKRAGLKQPETPGPAAYGVPNISLIKKSVPAFTMGARRSSKPRAAMPGPGAYTPSVSYVLPSAPGFTINGRPNPCVRPYILPADNEF